jgi:hypothetical protein
MESAEGSFVAEDFESEINACLDQGEKEIAEATAAESGSPDAEELEVEAGDEQDTGEPSTGDGEGDGAGEGETEGVEPDEGGDNEGDSSPAGAGGKPAPSTISDEALTAAVQAGLSVADARTFQSDDALLRVVRNITRLSESRVPPAEVKEPTPEVDLIAALPQINEDDYDPNVVKMFDGMKAILQDQQKTIASFQEGQAASAQASQEAVDREVTQWFDKSMNDLGFDVALGVGGHGDQALGSSQLAKREEIAKQASVLMAGYNQTGQPAPQRDEIFQAAARLVLVDEYQTMRDEKLSSELKDRAGQHINRAGGKKTKIQQSPEDEIAAMLDNKYPPSQ